VKRIRPRIGLSARPNKSPKRKERKINFPQKAITSAGGKGFSLQVRGQKKRLLKQSSNPIISKLEGKKEKINPHTLRNKNTRLFLCPVGKTTETERKRRLGGGGEKACDQKDIETREKKKYTEGSSKEVQIAGRSKIKMQKFASYEEE